MNDFIKAKPVWIENREHEVNCRAQFKAVCPKKNNARIHIATSGIYQLYINGNFVSYGPARAGKNHFRMENIDISSFLTINKNIVVIEVAGYFCSSFYLMKQNSFIQAEVVSDESVLVASGFDFTARINPYYIQRIQRYSYQRTFAEAYRYLSPNDCFFTDLNYGTALITEVEKKYIIERTVPYPEYERINVGLIASGSVKKVIPEKYNYDRYILQVGFKDEETTGWKLEDLECAPEKDWQEMKFISDGQIPSEKIMSEHYNIYKFPHNATGMIRLTINCSKPMTIYLAFDEILSGQIVNPRRIRCCNIVRYELSAGNHTIQTFEVYTMKYVQLIALDGNCKVDNISLIEYKHHNISIPQFSDEKLQMIADAAVETYRQNAVDLFTDCPSRERAGWLCDSFFLARTEYALTGKNIIEEAFLENFLYEKNYDKLPAGMVPMCYPADHFNGSYIPNWALWLVIELLDYYKKRNGKKDLIERYRDKIYGIIDYFKAFENSDGLLENLNGWVFIEWSRANDMVQGINYPSNMLYYAALKAVSELYEDLSLDEKAEKIKIKINEQSFDGNFYVDCSVRTSKGIFPVRESTEVCQYYAFFCGIATRDTHSQLFDRLINKFGPKRNILDTYPAIYKAAPFIGNYLRLDILKNNGYDSMVKEDIREYFYYMAAQTGTLWEMASTTHSCNHGFASCVLYWML